MSASTSSFRCFLAHLNRPLPRPHQLLPQCWLLRCKQLSRRPSQRSLPSRMIWLAASAAMGCTILAESADWWNYLPSLVAHTLMDSAWAYQEGKADVV
jgi:hypothetical protein